MSLNESLNLCEHVDNAIGAGAKNVRIYIRQTERADLFALISECWMMAAECLPRS